jgi:hypothetical protein
MGLYHRIDDEGATPFAVFMASLEAVVGPDNGENIKAVFNRGCPDIKIDKAFIRELNNYAQSFANKNEDHIAFFGGALMGVHQVRFRTEDRNRWFDDILEADDLSIEEELHRLPAIVPSRQVSSDVMNLSCLWLTHRIYTSTHLSQREKEEAMIDAILVLQYKFITSILAHWFRYPANEAVAVATYASLSKKFGLKVHGSWRALLLARANDILAPGTIHYKTYTQFNDDLAIVYMVNDIQGRIKDILKNIRDVFETVSKDPKGLIRSTGNTVTLDGVTRVKDKQRNYVIYRRYIHDVMGDRSTFIRDELVSIISSAMSTMPRALLEETLTYMAVNSGANGDPQVEQLVDETLTHAFDYLTSNRGAVAANDIGGLVAKMRSLYMASRGSDPTLLKMRDLAEKIVLKSIKSKNSSVVAAVRTGAMLYIILRTFTMNHYGK